MPQGLKQSQKLPESEGHAIPIVGRMQLKFGYPRRGLTGQFNTFRLGKSWAGKVEPGSQVDLVDSRSSKQLARATVTRIEQGTLTEMAQLHAGFAHNWKEHPADERAGLLVASMKKRYPPGRVLDTSIVTVIYMQEEPPE